MKNTFDLIVLGAGSGGLAAAKRAALHGARVAIVEADRVGGTCVIRGCVPKKLLVYGSKYNEYLDNAKSYGVQIGDAEFNIGVLLSNVRQEVDRLNSLHVKWLGKAGIQLFKGRGHLNTENSILIDDCEQENSIELKARNILIAVGGRPVKPSIQGASLGWVSDDVFLQNVFPKKVVVVGAGFIACEFACIFNNLGLNVVQLVRGDRLLKGFDQELSSILEEQMLLAGIEIKFKSNVISIYGKRGDLKVDLESGESINAEALLFATGREPCIQDLNLDKIGLELEKGKIKVNKFNQTNIPHIYAVGDVTNKVNLTPVAIEEGRIFADRIYASKDRYIDYNLIPKAVFSQPEISSVGLTEEEASFKYGKENIDIYKSIFTAMSQSLPKNNKKCLLKLVVEKISKKVIGCHMAGENSSEIIQMASIAIGMGATKNDFDRTMALHPTVAEEFVTMT